MYNYFFFFNDTATTEIYSLSLHDALPICLTSSPARARARSLGVEARDATARPDVHAAPRVGWRSAATGAPRMPRGAAPVAPPAHPRQSRAIRQPPTASNPAPTAPTR